MIDNKKIELVLDSVRPYLQEDEGDVELVSVTELGIVQVRLLGTCANCPMSVMTLRAGIERALINKIPEIKRVESVN